MDLLKKKSQLTLAEKSRFGVDTICIHCTFLVIKFSFSQTISVVSCWAQNVFCCIHAKQTSDKFLIAY